MPEGGDENDSITLFGRALYGSGREAVADAEARGWEPGSRVGFILCSSLGEIQGWRDLYFKHGGHLRRRHFLQMLPSTAPSMFMAEYGFKGPSLNVGAACASGALGVILARQWLTTGFAVALVLTRQPDAKAYAHVLGAGYTHDAFHPIAIKPDGIQVAAAWTDAIADAGSVPTMSRMSMPQHFLTNERCQPRIVFGVMRSDRQRSRGTKLARRATRARSDQLKRGRATWRRSTPSW